MECGWDVGGAFITNGIDNSDVPRYGCESPIRFDKWNNQKKVTNLFADGITPPVRRRCWRVSRTSQPAWF